MAGISTSNVFWEVVSLIGGKGNLEELTKRAFVAEGILKAKDHS